MYPKVFGDDPEVLRLISLFEHVAPGKSIPPFLLVVAGHGMRLRAFPILKLFANALV